MIKLSVMYPRQEGKKFDLSYYLKDHFALVQRKWQGLMKDAYVTRGLAGGAPGAPPLYHIMAHIGFESMEDLEKAMQQGAELFADIPNFTDIQPVVQIGEVLA